MEDMRKRPGADVTADDASSSSSLSPSAKRRRDQTSSEATDISVHPAADDVLSDSGDVISVPPMVNDVVGGSAAIVSVPPVVNNDNDVIGDDNDDIPALYVWPAYVHPPRNSFVTASDDVALSELTSLLDLNNAAAAPATPFTFAENPSRSPRVFQTMSTSYVTINGNEESCGSSYSDNDSSVMASVARDDRQRWMRGHEWYNTGECSNPNVSAWDVDDTERWAREIIEAPELDEDWDDAALARFLGEETEDPNAVNRRKPFSGSN